MKNILISEKQLEELVKTIKENSNEELEEESGLDQDDQEEQRQQPA